MITGGCPCHINPRMILHTKECVDKVNYPHVKAVDTCDECGGLIIGGHVCLGSSNE